MADTYTRAEQLTKVGSIIASTGKNDSGIMAQISRTIDDITITKAAVLELQLAASGTITITPANHLGSAGSFKYAAVMIQSSSTSTSMTVEINNSGDAIACEMWVQSGSAGITQIELAETGTSDTLDVVVVIAN